MGNGQALTAQLVNLAQYYGNAERHNEAVALFEEALKAGEESGHSQVDVIRKMLVSICVMSGRTFLCNVTNVGRENL
jgi:hypothetical protein